MKRIGLLFLSARQEHWFCYCPSARKKRRAAKEPPERRFSRHQKEYFDAPSGKAA